jgi:hypothetical protein
MHPDIGQTRLYRGQMYECVDAFPHVTRDGRNVMLLVVKSGCVDCHQAFEFWVTSNGFLRRRLLRRCEGCRRPGSPVGPVARNRPKSTAMTPRERQMHQVLVDLAEEQRDRVSSDARGWVRTKDWIHALVKRGVFSKAEVCAGGFYYRARRRLIKKGRLGAKGPAVRAL